MKIPAFVLTLLALSAASPLSAQIVVTNGDFSTQITHSTSVSNTSSLGVWYAPVLLGTAPNQISNWTALASSTGAQTFTGFDGQAVGRTGNTGSLRTMAQVIDGTSTAAGSYAFSFNYSIVDATATVDATLGYQVWGIARDGGSMSSLTLNNGTSPTFSVTGGGANAKTQALLSNTLTLSSTLNNSAGSPSNGSISGTFTSDGTFDRYVVLFYIGDGHTTTAANTWNQGQKNNFVAIDNVAIGVVPEPSAYAALAGAAVLGFVTYRRRRRA